LSFSSLTSSEWHSSVIRATSDVVKSFFNKIENIFIDLLKKDYISSSAVPVLRRRNPVCSGKEALAAAEVPYSHVFRSMLTFVTV